MKTKTTCLLGLLAGSMLLANLASATVLTVAYYRLGENDPGAANGNPANPTQGYLTNFPALSAFGTVPTYSTSTGVSGSTLSVAFNGGGYSGSPIPLANNWGLEAWVYAAKANNTSPDNGDIAMNGNYAASGGMGLFQSGNAWWGLVSGISWVQGPAVQVNTWTHLAIVDAGGVVTLYVNGVAAARGPAPAPVTAGVGDLSIGDDAFSYQGKNASFDGNVDEVRVFTFEPGAFSTSDLELSSVPPQIITAPGSINWAGGNGTWDINDSTNLVWENANGSTYYQENSGYGNYVQFDNTVGSGGTVTLDTMVSPGSVTITNPTAAYTLSGSGGIAGNGSLTKAGAGTFTLATANDYAGATLVNDGTLALSGGGALAINTSLTINGGTLDMGSADATNDLGNDIGIMFGANGGNLNGSGTLWDIGADASAVGFNVAASGNAVVNENLVVLTTSDNYSALASVGSGGTLTINGHLDSQTSGNGIWLQGGGTLVLNHPTNNFSAIGMWQNGGTISTPYFSALGTSGYLQTQQLTGPGTFIYTGAGVTNSFTFISAAPILTILNNGSGVMAVGSIASYGAPSSATPQTLTLGGSSDITFLGTIEDANSTTPGAFITDLVKTNADTLTLAGNNPYSGSTTISEGTLVGVTGGSCTNSAVTLAAAAGDTAVLGVAITDNTMQWTIPSLTVDNGGMSSDLEFDFGALTTPSTTAAPLNVTGSVTLNTTPGITITGSYLPVSSGNGYPLMTWAGSGPATTGGMTLTLPAGSAGNLAIVGNTLYLQVTTGIIPIPQAPVFSPAGGVYLGAQTVTIASDAGSTIHYTTDGSNPTTSGTVVAGASPVMVTVPANVVDETLQAYASLTGAPANGAVSAASYNTTLTSAPATQPMVTGVNDGPLRDDLTGTVGYNFTMSSSPIQVTALGCEDWTGQGTGGSGLQISHVVTLWDSSGNLIASATVPAGTAGSYVAGYWYAPLTSPVTLNANATYILGVNEVAGEDYWPGSAGTYFPGFSLPLFAGIADLTHANVVWGTTYPAAPTEGDESGGTSIWLPCNLQGSVTTAVAAQPVKLVNGSVQFSALGSYGASYRIWASTNLALTPITSTWSNVSSGTFNGSSVIYTDTGTTNYPFRFYTITIP